MNESRFDGMGEIYARFRPNYAPEFINYIFTELGADKNSVIADIGSGTGKLTAQLAPRCGKIYAVEPNADMRRIAERDLKDFANYISVAMPAENTGLEANCADIITVAQAFHWFNAQNFKAECRRILKPGGKVVLVWNRKLDENDFMRETDILTGKFCDSYKGRSDGALRGDSKDDDFSGLFEGKYEVLEFQNDYALNEEQFIGGNLSSSYAPKAGSENYATYVDGLKDIFGRYQTGGVVVIPNVTRCFAGEV
ncbi:MAG: class I SAM-dependent methyltransferase [Clostridiales bacterium]|nr:class I SAM-dependent methyltransferase [Clostridiales bacterium]